MEQIFDEYRSFASANKSEAVLTNISLVIYEDQNNIMIAGGEVEYFASGEEGRAFRRESFTTVKGSGAYVIQIKYPAGKTPNALTNFSIVNEIKDIVVNIEFPQGNHIQIPVTGVNTVLQGTGKSVINPGKQAIYTIYHEFSKATIPR